MKLILLNVVDLEFTDELVYEDFVHININRPNTPREQFIYTLVEVIVFLIELLAQLIIGYMSGVVCKYLNGLLLCFLFLVSFELVGVLH